MARPSCYPRKVWERAIRMVAEPKNEYQSEFAAIESVGELGIGSKETLCKWTRARGWSTSGGHERGVRAGQGLSGRTLSCDARNEILASWRLPPRRSSSAHPLAAVESGLSGPVLQK
jgi:hypothetical protein